MKNKILLIGGAGYIGLVLSDYLLKKGFKVKCLDNLLYSQDKCLNAVKNSKNFEFIEGDIKSFKIKSILKDVNNVVLLAGLVGDPITKKYPKEAEETNHLYLKKVINDCNGENLSKVVFVSTCSNYGLIKSEDFADENYKLNPISSYARQKVEIEKYILSQKGNVDYSSTILRFATAFGLSSRMRFDLTINHFTRAVVQEKKLEIYDANTWRPYCHVTDFARLIETVLISEKSKTDFQIFNAGSDKNNFTKKQIFEEINKIIPTKNVSFKEGSTDPRNYRVNFEKVKKVLNFDTEISIQRGIKEIYQAIQSNQFKEKSKSLKEMGNFQIKK